MPGRAPLVYVWVDDVETTGVTVVDQRWGHELPVQDFDGDRLRIAVPVGQRNVDAQFGEGTVDMLTLTSDTDPAVGRSVVHRCRLTFWGTWEAARGVRLLVESEPRSVLEDAVGSEQRGVNVDG